MSLLDALLRALRNLFSVRMLWLLIWPMLAALLLWGLLAAVFWDDLNHFFVWALGTLGVRQWFEGADLHILGVGLSVLLHLILLVPAVMFTALMITALFAVPIMVRHVAQAHYPGLEQRHGGTFVGSLGNALLGTLGYLGLWIATLPLWLFGPLGALAPLLAAGYLNQRLFRYDALAEHADRAEMRAVFCKHRAKLWLLGGLLALLQYVPGVNFFAPVLTGLAFVHFLLEALFRQRASGNGLRP